MRQFGAAQHLEPQRVSRYIPKSTLKNSQAGIAPAFLTSGVWLI
jgi:hypothetical protein